MLGNSNGLESRFSHKAAITLAEFSMTMNMATQAFAVDGANAENVQTTGGGHCVINGVHIASLTADAELDISADTQLTAWATGQSYTSVDVRYVEDGNGNKQWYKCIASHTSAAANKPGQKDSINTNGWKDYWTESSNRCENAVGDVVPTLYSAYYLCLADAAGTLTLVKAGPTALDAAVELQIPQFDPSIFVAIGTLKIDSAGFTLGTTSTAGISTFAQLIGPVYPHADQLDKN